MGRRSNPLSDLRPASGLPAGRQATAASNTTCTRFSARMFWPRMRKPATTSAGPRDGWACHVIRSIAPFVTSKADTIAQDNEDFDESGATGSAACWKIQSHVQREGHHV